MRILMAVRGTLAEISGATQIALRLADALREIGHEVELRDLAPAARGAGWWSTGERERAALAAEARSAKWDVIDTYPWLIPEPSPGSSILVARSVQPELEYLRLAEEDDRALSVPLPRRLAHRLYRRLLSRVVVRGWRRADAIVCLGEEERRMLAAKRPLLAPKLRSYRVAPSAADRARFREIAGSRSRGAVKVGSSRFLWIGRWTHQKGTDELVEFAERLLRDLPDAEVTVAGTGVDPRPSLPQALRRASRFHVRESFDRRELDSLLASHDAGLFTSRVEGWGLSIQEMLESGMPVYATRTGAGRELREWFPRQLRDFPPDPNEELPGREDPSVIARYEERFDWQAIASDYIAGIRGGTAAR